MPRALKTLLIVVAACALAWLLQIVPVTGVFFTNVNHRIYDGILQLNAYLRLDRNRPVYDNIVIISIDDKSIEELGASSSWPSHYYADLVRQLNTAAPKLIAFDVFFADSTGFSSHARERIFSEVPSSRRTLLEEVFDRVNGEREFAKAIAEAGNVFLAMFDNPRQLGMPELPAALTAWKVEPSNYLWVTNPHPPLPVYSSVAYGVGFAQAVADESGIIHDLPLFMRHRDEYYVNFSFQACLDLLDADSMAVNHSCVIYSGAEKLRTLPLNSRGEYWLNYYPERPAFRYISFSDLIFERVPPEYFTDKIILVGATATGFGDLWTIPLGYQVPGVELHATFIRNILEDDHVRWIGLLLPYLSMLGLVFGLAVIVNRSRPGISILYIVLVSLLLLAAFYILYSRHTLCLNHIAVLLPWLLCSLALVYQHYYNQILERKQVRDAFGHYVSEQVVEQIMQDRSALRIGGEKKRVAVLITDIRNFTAWCESSPPELVSDFLHRYFNLATEIIINHKGMVDKYMGDAILALFNVPVPQEDYIYHACAAALEIDGAIRQLMAEYGTGLDNIGLGIAVACGEVIVGNMGSDRIFNYTGIGNTMNLCSRLENLNKYYKTRVIIDEEAYADVKGRLSYRHLDYVSVKGMQTPTHIYELRTKREPWFDNYEQALEALIRGDFDTAENLFRQTLVLAPEDPPTIYKLGSLVKLDRAHWDGVLHYDRK